MIPSTTPGGFFALPDNGYGAQTNSADFVIGFYEIITLQSKVPLRTLRVQPCKDASLGAHNGRDDDRKCR